MPHEVGKIPEKVESSFDGFSTNEYKIWTILFSVYALKGIIPPKQLQCFQKFVLAFQYLCRRVISKRDIIVAMNYCYSLAGLLSNCMDLAVI